MALLPYGKRKNNFAQSLRKISCKNPFFFKI